MGCPQTPARLRGQAAGIAFDRRVPDTGAAGIGPSQLTFERGSRHLEEGVSVVSQVRNDVSTRPAGKIGGLSERSAIKSGDSRLESLAGL